MKKILLLLLVAFAMTANAQRNYEIENQLKLKTVNKGTASDSVLVRGADKLVKFIPRSEFGGGVGSSPTLQGVLGAGNIATTPIVIKADTEVGTTVKSTIEAQSIYMEVKVGSVGNMVTFGASNIQLLSWYEPYSSWVGTASLDSSRNPVTGNSYGILNLTDELNYGAYIMAHPPVDGVSVGCGEFYLPKNKGGIFAPRTLATTDDVPKVGVLAPLSSTDTGTTGEIRVVSGYIYWCTAPNTWIRAAGYTF